ncbi:MAG: hypothetical protein LBO63_08280 [Oscillospiraceae bacterium]|nr:hypothetical protein [Oscillospiraceae bacterium]
MAHTWKPVSDRVEAMRQKYLNTKPEICTSRYKLVTEFYMDHPELEGSLRRAKNLKNICENIAIRIDDDEVIVGAQSSKYRATALYPENSVSWLKQEIANWQVSDRKIDPYIISKEDREYVLETIDFWNGRCMSDKADAELPDEYKPFSGNGVTMFSFMPGNMQSPVGHFATNYNKAIRKGFGAIKAEADQKRAELLEAALPGTSIDQYNFYRSVSIVCEGIITLTKRYAKLAEEKLAAEKNPQRRKELEMMVEGLNWTVEKPARNFYEAAQCLYMYQTALCLDANMHGMSLGRVDKYLGDFLQNDIDSGTLTPEYAQEIMDLMYLKFAEMNKIWSAGATESNPGYTSGQLMTLGGMHADGSDASNIATFYCLQTMGRLFLHDPPQALMIHKNTPPELWEAAIETTKKAGGVPTFENADLIIPALVNRGVSLEDAREYGTLIGCVEPSVCGMEWPACGGNGAWSYENIVNAFLLALNDGYTPVPMMNPFMPAPPGTPNTRVGKKTGYLYEMNSIEEVCEAFNKQVTTFVRWRCLLTNSNESIARYILPQPLVSATMDGCMEKGMDVMWGGAKYNSTGDSCVGIGNVADSLNIINQLCFVEKKYTTREVYDALMANWEGYEEMRSYIINNCKHYGNGYPECDKFMTLVSEYYAAAVTGCSGPRGNNYAAGCYPVTTNVMFGKLTKATPDGRLAGTPLADGIASPQGFDKNGPAMLLTSMAAMRQDLYGNGTLMNLKFSPLSLQGDTGTLKLQQLLQTYFAMGGMEVQINVVDPSTLKDAMERPEKYKNLVVRVAGFSAYFTELLPEGQRDLISRTTLSM